MMDDETGLEITAVPPEGVELVWSDVEPMLEPAVKASGGRYNTVAVLDKLLRGELMLWLILDEATPVATYTTRAVRYPTGKMGLVVDWLGGDGMGRWLGLVVDTLTRYGKDIGCDHVELVGRMGWLRALKPFGYHGEAVVSRLELTDD